MRVLHLTDDLSGISGVRSYLENLVEAMEPLGVHCELETLGSPDHVFHGAISRWASRRYYVSMARRLRRLPRPDIVHAHNLWMRLSPTPLLAARKAGIPVVMTVHDYHLVCPRKWMVTSRDEPCATGFDSRCLVSSCRGAREGPAWIPYNDLRWLKVALHRQLLRRWVDLFISPSQHLAGWMRSNLGVQNAVTIPNFTSAPSRTSSPRPPRQPSVLYAGRLAREKGIDVLLKAMALVLETGSRAVLVVAGDGPQRGHLEASARRRLPPDSFRFTGRVSPEALARLHNEASVVALPTLWMENCPVAVLEAMAHGCPVVATRIGGLPELVDDGVTGFLFDRKDPVDLGSKILRLIQDPGLRQRTGQAAAARHRAQFTPEVHAARLAATYGSLLEGQGAP
ncbi:MAG: glycosyltransferase family 4 protein [Acidobacteria bacterium]|nr:glycosyltransferase family 4 protein [Acidobacteriota bacterium]